MLRYDFDIQFTKGKSNVVADCLSRSAFEKSHEEFGSDEIQRINMVEEVVRKEDPDVVDQIKSLIDSNKREIIQKRFPEYGKSLKFISIRDNRLVYKENRWIPPEILRGSLLKTAHCVHSGINRTKAKLNEYYWWPNINRDVDDFIDRCQVCKNSPRTFKTNEQPLILAPIPKEPWSKIGIDLVGPIDNMKKNQYILTLIDYKTKWPEVFTISSISSSTIIKHLKEVFARQGMPKLLVSDNGRQFISEEMRKFLQNCGVKHHCVALYSPQSNGLIERFNKVLKEKLFERKLQNKSLHQTIQDLLFDYRSTPHSVTGLSPFELLNSRRMRTKLSQWYPFKITLGEYNEEMVKDKLVKMKQFFDKRKGVKNRTFEKGDLVKIRRHDGGWSDTKTVDEDMGNVIKIETGEKYPKRDVSKK